MYAVNQASQYVENLIKEAWNNVKKILKGTSNFYIKFYVGDNWKVINAFSDADFAGDQNTRCSTSEHVIKLGESPIIWKSKRQSGVALSTTESEFIAACEAVKRNNLVR